MNRDFLKQLLSKIGEVDESLMKEIIDAIMTENGKGINESKTKIDELTGQLGLKDKELNESKGLIEELKKASKGNEDMQNKFTEYEGKVAQLQAENEQLKIENEIKVELLSNKAKSSDLDYLIFKIKQEHQDLKLDENGKLKGIDFKDIKTAYPSNFEVESKKVVDVNNLPKIKDGEPSISKEEFNKMGYSSKVKLKQENPEMYNTLVGNK